MENCLIDDSQHDTVAALHTHLRSLGIKQEDYYKAYVPRKCRQSGVLIPYVNREQYLNQDFLNHGAMKIWFKQNPEEAKIYAIELLDRRKKQKGILNSLCEVELKSLKFPSIGYYLSLSPSYRQINDQIGLINRFDYSCAPQFSVKSRDFRIIVDTREQYPLTVENPLKSKLDYGDYTASGSDYKKIHIERKSLQDLIGTFGNEESLERFIREIDRAKVCGGYIVVLCESDINSVMTFNINARITKYTKVRPEMLFHNIREIIQEYDNVQFAFCNGRVHMKSALEKILLIKNPIKNVDIQYNIEGGII